ncbi:unnamed protein product [Allacma fusca]|uniref:OCEL domain-containing protein n=1 Tax=Allacma fusca TaxID=39272 RepID=A0A8J2NRB5_9HEXA|nr:unnamed protein product [Allacma fusca]
MSNWLGLYYTRIHIPSSHTSDGHSFDFSLSSNADIEGPQGSFECIQQNGSRSLESMGTLPYKMRIQAKDDVYDLTRQKISYVEDKRKQDCAKEIKQPGAENGRKVKKKIGGSTIPVPQRREPSPTSNSYTNSKSSLLGSNNSSNNKFSNGYSNSGNQHYGNNHQPNYKNTGFNSHSHGSMSKVATGGGVNLDIQRRPLRERLIHMLALKPLKKPEIVAKLYRDGMKDKDKKMLMMTLQQVSQLKDNVYNLSRGIWNDVHEDWPFYTEEERQIMKRRKPQNLTPPGSDCSVGSGTSGSSSSPRSTTSGSGHSPTSYTSSSSGYSSINNHHSPYGPAIKSSSNYSSHNATGGNGSLPGGQSMQQSQGVKRPNDFDGNSNGRGGSGGGFSSGNGQNNDNIPTKKQRVSHFKRPNCSNGSSSNSANNVRVDSRDSPNSNKEVPHQQPQNQQQSSPYQQRNGNSHNSVGNGYNNQERWSPSANGLAPHNNHKSPKNSKDHHSPPYNSSTNNHSTNNTAYHHQSSNHNSQGKDYGDDTYTSTNNNSWSGRNGHHGTQPNYSSNQPHQNSTMQDNGYGLDPKLPDLDDNDSVDSGNGSSSSSCSGSGIHHQSSSINASVNNHNHGGSKSTVFSSSSSSATYGTTNSDLIVNSSSGNVNVNGVNSNSIPNKRERERDFDGIASNNISGCNRVTSTTNSGITNGFHTPQPSPDSQIESLQSLQQQQQPPPPSLQPPQQQHHRKIPRLEQAKESVVDKDEKDQEISSETRGSRGHGNSSVSRDKVKEKNRGDRDREKDKDRVTERVCDRPKSEIPSHLLDYTTIRTPEQRIRYKADFNAEYEEYRDLHSVIDKVSKKFAQLQERLLKEEKGSEGYQVVRNQIINEYNYNKSSKKYVDARARFAHMHEKLSHIKRLVMEYDSLHSTDGSGSGCRMDDEDF